MRALLTHVAAADTAFELHVREREAEDAETQQMAVAEAERLNGPQGFVHGVVRLHMPVATSGRWDLAHGWGRVALAESLSSFVGEA